ncbi:MAG: helix-turn-helix transcriptional regulator [Lachnospiraceae bacterium]|nr:helix-turn-helix transcriptional regulator [Lachnospiraceae bacterium]
MDKNSTGYKGIDLTGYQRKLKEIRRKNNKTQKEMSELINMSEEAWGKNERGECSPSTEFLIKLYQGTGVDLGTLFFDEKDELDRMLAKIHNMSESGLSIMLLEIAEMIGEENSIKLIEKMKGKK